MLNTNVALMVWLAVTLLNTYVPPAANEPVVKDAALPSTVKLAIL